MAPDCWNVDINQDRLLEATKVIEPTVETRGSQAKCWRNIAEDFITVIGQKMKRGVMNFSPGWVGNGHQVHIILWSLFGGAHVIYSMASTTKTKSWQHQFRCVTTQMSPNHGSQWLSLQSPIWTKLLPLFTHGFTIQASSACQICKARILLENMLVNGGHVSQVSLWF